MRNSEYAIQVHSINIQEVRCGTARKTKNEGKEKKNLCHHKNDVITTPLSFKTESFCYYYLRLEHNFHILLSR